MLNHTVARVLWQNTPHTSHGQKFIKIISVSATYFSLPGQYKRNQKLIGFETVRFHMYQKGKIREIFSLSENVTLLDI